MTTMKRTLRISTPVKQQFELLPEGQILSFRSEKQSESAYFKALSRLAQSGKLVRLEKEKYYKPKITRFGILRPSETEILKALTQKGNKTTGYLTGNALYNRWGLTTQVASTLTIAQRNRLPEKELSGHRIRFAVRPFPFKESDILMMQLLDALTDIQKIPDASPEKIIPALAEKIRNLQSSQLSRMMRLALEYPPSTRALLGALLETYMPDQRADILRKSLHPLTKYRLKGIETVLPNKAKWNFYDAARG